MNKSIINMHANDYVFFLSRALLMSIAIVGLLFISTDPLYAKNKRDINLQAAKLSMSSEKLAACRLKFRKKWQVNSLLSAPKKSKRLKRRNRNLKPLSASKLAIHRSKFQKKLNSKTKKSTLHRSLSSSLSNSLKNKAAKVNINSLLATPVMASIERSVGGIGDDNSENCLKWSASKIDYKADLFKDSIQRYSLLYRVDSRLIKSIITAESCFKTKALSNKGAQGLMQLIPDTAKRFGVTNSYDSDQNIHAGTRYLRFLLDRFNGDLEKSIAAYNAGEGAVDKYKGIPPYKETKRYVRNVLKVHGLLEQKDKAIIAARNKAKLRKANKKKYIKKYVSNNRSRQPVYKVYKPHLVGKINGGNRFKRGHPLYRKSLANRYAYNPKNTDGKPGRQGWGYSRRLAPQLFKK